MKDNELNDVFRFIAKLDDEALIEWRESLIKRFEEIDKAAETDIIDRDFIDLEYKAIKIDLVQANKELLRRGIAIDDTGIQNTDNTEDDFIFCGEIGDDVKSVRVDFYKWVSSNELLKTASIETEYSDELLLKDYFLKLGLTHGVFNLLDSKRLLPTFIEIPFIEKDNTVLWNQTFDNIKLSDYLSYYDYSELCICPFNPDAVGGIGAAGVDFFIELYQNINEFCAQNPLVGNLLSGVILNVCMFGVNKVMNQLREFSARGATPASIEAHLSLRYYWTEKELLHLYPLDSEALEYMMLGIGYVKKDGIYSKMKKDKVEK